MNPAWAHTQEQAGALHFAAKKAWFGFGLVGLLLFYCLTSKAVLGHCYPHRLLVGTPSKVTANKPLQLEQITPPNSSKLWKYLHLVVSLYSPHYDTAHSKPAMHRLVYKR